MHAKHKKTQVSKLWYSVAIDTVPLPEKPATYTQQSTEQITSLLINQIVFDALEVAIRNWPSNPHVSGMTHGFSKQYSVTIDTVPLPEKPADRLQFVAEQVAPLLQEIVADALSVAAGTWQFDELSGTRPAAVKKQYSVAIDTIPLPEEPAKRVQLIASRFAPVINQIVHDAMTAVIRD